MKQDLQITQTLKQKLEALVDAVTDAIVEISDYLLVKHITLSEAILFGLSFCRASWYLCFGVENANYNYYFSDGVWVTVFMMTTGIHLAGFFCQTCRFRIIAAYLYSAIWGFLTVLALISRTNAPAVPTLGVLAFLSFLMIIRLTDENGKKEC